MINLVLFTRKGRILRRYIHIIVIFMVSTTYLQTQSSHKKLYQTFYFPFVLFQKLYKLVQHHPIYPHVFSGRREVALVSLFLSDVLKKELNGELIDWFNVYAQVAIPKFVTILINNLAPTASVDFDSWWEIWFVLTTMKKMTDSFSDWKRKRKKGSLVSFWISF